MIEFDLRGLYLRSISLLGSTMHTPDQFEVLVAAANAGGITPTVSRTFPHEAVRAATRRSNAVRTSASWSCCHDVHQPLVHPAPW